jgi:hypothetical protein
MPRVYTQAPMIERVLARVSEDADGCWLWNGKTGHGYGRIGGRIDGVIRERPVHHITFEHFVGPIPLGMTLDHICHDPDTCEGGPTCKHRRCANPAHLQVATVRDNVLRSNGISARYSRATHCINGHEFTPENTYVSRRQRQCRACKREQLKRWRREHREHYSAQRSAYRARRRAAGMGRAA